MSPGPSLRSNAAMANPKAAFKLRSAGREGNGFDQSRIGAARPLASSLGVMIDIVESAEDQRRQLASIDSSFRVESELKLAFVDGKCTYETVPVAPYEKRYAREEAHDDSGHTIFLAFVNSALAGGIELSPAWNGFAYVHHLAVRRECRRSGVATSLAHKALAWSQSMGLAGVSAETQSNNVAACALYAQVGFQLCGFDSALYRGMAAHSQEVALFWYWEPLASKHPRNDA